MTYCSAAVADAAFPSKSAWGLLTWLLGASMPQGPDVSDCFWYSCTQLFVFGSKLPLQRWLGGGWAAFELLENWGVGEVGLP